jgi:hypothetical protein
MRQKTIHTFLKRTFIPHKENEYKPHFFHEHVLLSLLIGVVILLLVSFTSYTVLRTTKFGSTVVASVLVDLTNKTRIEHSLPPLKVNEQLIQAATLKGGDMVTRGYFSHYAPDGTSPWHWFKVVGYHFRYAGENLAINFTSSQAVEDAWLNSPKHRENILSNRYQDIGVATVDGTPSNVPTLFVVQMFGTPLASSTTTQQETKGQAHLYEKLIFNASNYIKGIYYGLLILLIVALMLMIGIEIRKQHYLHIGFGVLLGIIIILCISINSYFM